MASCPFQPIHTDGLSSSWGENFSEAELFFFIFQFDCRF